MAQDASKLWLQYDFLGAGSRNYQPSAQQIVVEGTSATAAIIRDELRVGLTGMLGTTPTVSGAAVSPGTPRDGAILAGTPATSPLIKQLGWHVDLASAGAEGFLIRTAAIASHRVTIICSETEIGVLYGAFHFLRLIQTLQPIDKLNISEHPRVRLRLLNHWDNLDGSIERGYAGKSLWQWNDLPGKLSPRYADYARANASIGINGSVLNNVNANAKILSADYLAKVKALADVFRPYGIRTFLSANFAAPKTLGNLPTADPLDPAVIAWWKNKAEEIYKLIPDFGGFLVKANSEGQPGPQDYQRTHAQGANVLADAVAPHGGIVMWRAFIYNEDVDPDRGKRAYIEFMALEGQFRPNVIVQVKNGPIDFMPREPFHSLFGALVKTPICAEVQIAQEYLGHSRHLVYLGTMWKEFLDADTFAKGPGSTVGKVIDGTARPSSASVDGPNPHTGITAVANTGTDANWCGHDFSQSNWYAFGRLAWNHELSAKQIAEEWARMTFSNDASVVRILVDMMMSSRETFVNYTMPLGLHHLIGGDHYAPMPWNEKDRRADWTAAYYHQAAEDGIGFDRTMRGNKGVGQYFPPVRDLLDDEKTCPENLLLWFHRCSWDHRMRMNSGRTLWDELCQKYYEGAQEARAMQMKWAELKEKIDPARHAAVSRLFEIQVTDAAKWRDQVLAYFQKFSRREIPAELK